MVYIYHWEMVTIDGKSTLNYLESKRGAETKIDHFEQDFISKYELFWRRARFPVTKSSAYAIVDSLRNPTF